MLTREEGERMAEAIHRLRPDWPVSSLFTFISARKTRPHRDLALELVYVALDPQTATPARIDQDGPWKRLGLVAGETNSLPVIDFATACDECLKPFEHLWHGGTGTIHDHEFRRPNPATASPSSLRESINRKANEDA